MLEFGITFLIMLFAGFSVTIGVLMGRRTSVHTCHGGQHPEVHAENEAMVSGCESCAAINDCRESAHTTAATGRQWLLADSDEDKPASKNKKANSNAIKYRIP